MPSDTGDRRYEFDPSQNAIFSRLASAMSFVAMAMLVPSVAVGAAAVLLGRSTFVGAAIVGPVAIAMAIMAAQLYDAAKHFRRIVTTKGNDVANLMAALDDMATAYRTQRWLWILVLVVAIVGLATAMVGR